MNIKLFSATTLSLTAMMVGSAHAYSNTQMSCNTNINGELSFANNQLVVKSTKDEKIVFKANGDVFVDGNQVDLNASQQTLANQYFNDVEASIPMVVDITVEALTIANVALTEVFTGLLGENSEVPKLIDNKLGDAATAIKDHVYQNPSSLTFNSQELGQEFGYNGNFDQQLDDITEEVMSTFMGEIFMVLGKAMMSGDSDFSSLEQRMEKLGTDIEQKAEQASLQLEDKATALCDRIKALDKTENQLQSINALRHLNMIQMDNEA